MLFAHMTVLNYIHYEEMSDMALFGNELAPSWLLRDPLITPVLVAFRAMCIDLDCKIIYTIFLI